MSTRVAADADTIAQRAQALADMLLVHPATVREAQAGLVGETWFTIDGCYDDYMVASYEDASAKWGGFYDDDPRGLFKNFLVCYDNELDLGVWRCHEGKTREQAAASAALGGWDSITAGMSLGLTDYDRKLYIEDESKVRRGHHALQEFRDRERRAQELRDRGNPLVIKELPEGRYRRGERTLAERVGLDV
jgi:hypothetical protein